MATENKSIRQLDESAGYHPEVNFIFKLIIGGVEIPASSLVNIVVREWIFDPLPRLELTLSDNGRIVDQFPLEDNMEIAVELNHFIFEEPPIKATFNLQDYEIANSAPGKSQQALITMTGIMKAKDMMYPIQNRSHSGKNSSEVFKKIFDESGLSKFDQRVDGKDGMNWLQIDETNHDFISHVLKRAYVNNDDAPFLFTTRHGVMVYTSLKTELKKKVEEMPSIVYNIESAMLNSTNKTKDEVEEELEAEKEDEKNNVLFFYNWKFKNFSGGNNKENSYGREFSYYDLTNNISREISSDEHQLSTHSLKEEENIGKIVKHTDYGVQDTNNVHENYILSKEQNDYLKNNWSSSYLQVWTRPSNNINLFDRVHIEVKSLLPIASKTDEVHSGQYIVGGIIHNASKDGIYNTVLVLFRNGMNIKGFKEDFESIHSSGTNKGGIKPPKIKL